MGEGYSYWRRGERWGRRIELMEKGGRLERMMDILKDVRKTGEEDRVTGGGDGDWGGGYGYWMR